LLSASRHQSDIGELRHTLDENDIRWLDVAVNQPVRVQRLKRFRQGKADANRFISREVLLAPEVAFQGARFVIQDIDLAASQMIIGQFHAVIEVVGSPTDVKNVNEPGMCARDRLERGHAFEFPKKRALSFKGAAIDNFHRAKRASNRPRQPNLAVSAPADHAKQFMIGDNRDLSGNFVRNVRFYTSRNREAIRGPHALSEVELITHCSSPEI
jgi:hypothetical protein